MEAATVAEEIVDHPAAAVVVAHAVVAAVVVANPLQLISNSIFNIGIVGKIADIY